MEKDLTPRLVRVADFVAEELEREANGMPPSYKEQADSPRRQAAVLRASDNPRMVRVWEETTT
jgi:hypothetical protein